MKERKECNVCHQEKDLDQFYRDSALVDGRKNTCKPCSRQRRRDWNARNPEKAKARASRGNAKAKANPRPPATEGVKTCRVCGEAKPVTEFYAASTSPDGRGYTCKPCSRVRSKRWNVENRERFNANHRASTAARADEINARRRERAATDPEVPRAACGGEAPLLGAPS